eukprot:GHVT01075228.1.p1 GENE.GHVT01075228.1~~GHVT01075228.1.p1  ORF type:complete len:246 (-),score=29.93 GHVT01075228.1:2022-2759(-)
MRTLVCLGFLFLSLLIGGGAERCRPVLAVWNEPSQFADVPAPLFPGTDDGYGGGTGAWAPNVTPLQDDQSADGSLARVPVHFSRESAPRQNDAIPNGQVALPALRYPVKKSKVLLLSALAIASVAGLGSAIYFSTKKSRGAPGEVDKTSVFMRPQSESAERKYKAGGGKLASIDLKSHWGFIRAPRIKNKKDVLKNALSKTPRARTRRAGKPPKPLELTDVRNYFLFSSWRNRRRTAAHTFPLIF